MIYSLFINPSYLEQFTQIFDSPHTTQHLMRSTSVSSQRLSVVRKPYSLLVSTKIIQWRCDYDPLRIIRQDLDLLLTFR